MTTNCNCAKLVNFEDNVTFTPTQLSAANETLKIYITELWNWTKTSEDAKCDKLCGMELASATE